MTQPVVVDASATVEMLLRTAVGRSLRRQVPDDADEWVPELSFAEVAGALRRAELHGGVPSARVSLALNDLLAAPVRRVQVRPLLSEAWTLRHNLTVTDAVYVVLARHLRAPLLTADLRLAAAPGLEIDLILPS